MALNDADDMVLPPVLRMHTRWLVLAPSVIAGYVWGKGYVVSTLELFSFCIAFASVGILGWTLYTALAPEPVHQHDADADVLRPRLGVFHLLWLGQYALFAAALAATWLGATFTALTRRHLPLGVSLLLVSVAALLYLRRRKGPLRPLLPRIPFDSLLLAGCVSFGFFRALSLHSFHAGALGHDTLQHLYWINTVDDYGYVPLVARGTNALEKYPMVFHLLVAAWRSAGVFGLSGPYMKMMPFLQAALACGFACELWLAAKPRSRGGARSMAPVLLGIFLSWHLTLGDGQEVYRVVDLSGTPRTSAGWILFGPPLLMIAQRVGTLPDVRPWLLGTLPLVVAVAFGINPVTLAYYLTFSLPFAAIFYVATRAVDAPPLPRWRKAFLLSGAVAVSVLATNSTLVGALAKVPVVAAVLRHFSVRTVMRGISTYVHSPPAEPPPALCTSPGISCAAELSQSTLLGGLSDYWATLKSGTLPGLAASPQLVWYFVVFSLPLIALAFVSFRYDDRPLIHRRTARAFLALLTACLLTPLGMMTVSAALRRIENHGDLLALLSTYYQPHHVYLSPWLQCLLATSSWCLLPAVPLRSVWFWLNSALGSALLAYNLSLFAPPALVNHRHANDELNIDWPELRAIRHLDDFIPSEDAVLIPSWFWEAGREHLMGTDGAEGPIVPHLTKRLFFGLTLGVGRDYSWADLHFTFCGPSAEARRKLLRQNNVRWMLLRHKDVRSRATFDSFRWVCGIRLNEDLHADYPPAWSERDLGLYRIHP